MKSVRSSSNPSILCRMQIAENRPFRRTAVFRGIKARVFSASRNYYHTLCERRKTAKTSTARTLRNRSRRRRLCDKNKRREGVFANRFRRVYRYFVVVRSDPVENVIHFFFFILYIRPLKSDVQKKKSVISIVHSY